MNPSSQVSKSAAFLCVLGLAFCAWVYTGQAEEACFTAGCQLYQETSLAGVSLWVVGMAAFFLLGVLSLLGFASLACALTFLGIFCDAFLLGLLLFTAPCLFCLVFAFLLFATYLVLRASLRLQGKSFSPVRFLVLCVWAFFFTCNVGVVLKSAAPEWAISENVEDANVHMYFSPSCTACRRGIETLSGSVDVAFFPVAESDWDIVRVARMQEELAKGENMFDALTAASGVERPGSLELWRPHMVLLRLRLLVNKAHVYTSGGGRVPFFEYRGLPSFLREESERQELGHQNFGRQPAAHEDAGHGYAAGASSASGTGGVANLLGSSVSGYCTGGDAPCPDDGTEGFTRRAQ